MWTKNGKKIIIKQLSKDWTNAVGSNFLFRASNDTDVTMGYSDVISGVLTSLDYMKPNITDNPAAAGAQYTLRWELYIGTGTTPPTEDDITLANPVSFTCPVLPQISRGNNYTTLLITYTFTNNTDETKTITEIGLCGRVKTSTSGNPAVLFNRRLLENPVTMEAGDIKVFTFTIDTSNLTE